MLLSLRSDRFKIAPFRRNQICLLRGSRVCAACVWCVLWFAAVGLAQKTPAPDIIILPKYDLHTEIKTKGTVDEVKMFSVGTKRDIRELVMKSGEETIHIYVCPKTFEDEMGISFAKGEEIAVTGSKVKQDMLDGILAREMVRGGDTLVFRDDKGNPVWNSRTGK